MSNQSSRFSEAKLEEFKELLNDNLSDIIRELNTLKQNQKEQKQQLASSNIDFNENSKHFQSQAKNKQLIRRLQRKSSEIKRALNRIDDKTYGVCTRSGNLIREERLKAMPTARFDIQPK